MVPELLKSHPNKIGKIMIENLEIKDLEPHLEIREENRKDLLHKITHLLAFIILGSFLLILLFQIILRPDKIVMPDYFLSIVSMIVGFYFAKSFDK